MSKEQVSEFLAIVGQDPAQQDAIKKVADGDNPAAAIAAAASERGYDFTAEEFVEVIDEIRRNEQLSEEELQAVTGGVQKPGVDAANKSSLSPSANFPNVDWLGLRY